MPRAPLASGLVGEAARASRATLNCSRTAGSRALVSAGGSGGSPALRAAPAGCRSQPGAATRPAMMRMMMKIKPEPTIVTIVGAERTAMKPSNSRLEQGRLNPNNMVPAVHVKNLAGDAGRKGAQEEYRG